MVTEKLSDAQGPLWTSLDNINKISANIEQITDDLKAGKGPMGMMLKSEDLLQQVVSNVTRLGQILQSIQAATDQAPATMELVKENLKTYRDTGVSVKARVDQAKDLLEEIKKSAGDLQVILENVKVGSTQIPRITTTFRDGIQEIRQGMEQIDRVVDSLQKNVFIHSHLPSEPPPENTTTGSRPE